MSNNIIEAVQKSLQTASLQKVDPNIQETKDKYLQGVSEKLAQAAIPAVLTGFYRYIRTVEGGKQLISADPSASWLNKLYTDKEAEVVEKVAQYSSVSAEVAKNYMETVAHESASLIKEQAGTAGSPEKIQSYMNSQRHNILVYLPAALQLGDLLEDESLDDRTNKMEGPVSNFMHKIENTLSGGGK